MTQRTQRFVGGVNGPAVWWAALAALVLLVGVVARLLPEDPPEPVVGPKVLNTDRRAEGPFAPPDGLSPEQRRALDSVADLAFAGAQTTVKSIDRTTYSEAMCGRGLHQPSLEPVWIVWLEGPFRTFTPTIPPGFEENVPWLPQHFERQVFIVNALDYISLQRFVEWPLPRDPKANCPTP